MKTPESYLEDVVQGVDISSVCDVGTGHGGVFHYGWWQKQDLAGKVAVDVHSFRPDIEGWCLVLADAQHLPFRGGVFDHLQSTEMLEHVPPEGHPKVLREFKRVTRKTVFLSASGATRHRGPEQRAIEQINPYQTYQQMISLDLLEEEGFEILYSHRLLGLYGLEEHMKACLRRV